MNEPDSIHDSSLPADLDSQVRSELRGGEQLLWVAQPRPDLFQRGSIPLMVFGIPWTAFSIILMVFMLRLSPPIPSGWLFLLRLALILFWAPFILGGLGLLSSPYWLKRRARQTCYALTDQRAILWEPDLLGCVQVRSYGPAALANLQTTENADGSGDLVFERRRRRTSGFETHGFMFIDNVQSVERLLRETLLSRPQEEMSDRTIASVDAGPVCVTSGREPRGGAARVALWMVRIFGVLIILVGCAPVIAVILGDLVLDETIEFWLVPMISLVAIAVGLGFLSVGRAEDRLQTRRSGVSSSKSRAKESPLRRLMAFFVGIAFALAGLAMVVESVVNFGDMRNPFEATYRSGDPGDMDDEGGYSFTGGFAYGIGAFMGMLVVSVGVGIAAPQVTSAFGPRGRPILRGVAAILAIAWHAMGIGACYSYCTLAPQPDVWPFLVVSVYEWLGLIPLALATSDGWERLRSVVWYVMGGGFLGALAGAVIGGALGGVAVVLSYAVGSGTVGTDLWLYATIGGGAVTSIAFALLRMRGWEFPSGDSRPALRRDRAKAPRSVVCRKCRTPLQSDLARCSRCQTPTPVGRTKTVGGILAATGFICIVGAYSVLGSLHHRLVDGGSDSTVLNYLRWMIFVGGWPVIEIGSVLASCKPAHDEGGAAGEADKIDGDTEEREPPPRTRHDRWP